MKKRLIYFLLLIVVVLFSLPYLLIPSNFKVSALGKTERSIAGTFRSLSKSSDWTKWWPGNLDQGGPFCSDFRACKFSFHGTTYEISGLFYNSLAVAIQKGDQDFESRMTLVSFSGDSTFIHWEYSVPTGLNPFTRIQRYRQAQAEKTNMDSILKQASNFLNVIANVYGHDVKLIMPKDTTLIVINLKTPAFPTTEDIYRSIHSLREYAVANQARENNFPMLQPNKNTPGAFESFVALSINKALPDKGIILHRRYVPWKDLMLEVQGGDSSIARARRELDNYIQDNQVQVMSRTFESLVTDRSLEKDSSKWVTRLICSIP
jgi:hypothetical protein